VIIGGANLADFLYCLNKDMWTESVVVLEKLQKLKHEEQKLEHEEQKLEHEEQKFEH
jgi:hypothetical protein